MLTATFVTDKSANHNVPDKEAILKEMMDNQKKSIKGVPSRN